MHGTHAPVIRSSGRATDSFVTSALTSSALPQRCQGESSDTSAPQLLSAANTASLDCRQQMREGVIGVRRQSGMFFILGSTPSPARRRMILL